MNKWFVQKDNIISGPFDQTQIEQYLLRNLEQSLLIWGKGMSEWLSPTEWNHYLNLNKNKIETATKGPVWKFKNDDKESEPLCFNDLILALKALDTFENAVVKNETLSKWESVFSISAVADALGVTRRNTPRVPILGFLVGERIDDHSPVHSKVVTISEGGCGVADDSSLRPGVSIKGVLQSPNLSTDIHIQADVVYVGPDGYTGLKFSSISPEFKSQIIEYINKFKES